MDTSVEYDVNKSESIGRKEHLFKAPYPTLWTAVLTFLIALLVVATVFGNALVMLAFVVDKSLRTQNNFFLLNLAISDFLVGAFCIPLYTPYVLTGRWTLGRTLCKLWLVMDYLLCTSSVFNIVLISYDRFLSVTQAVAYRAQQGKICQAVGKMVLVWVLAFLLYGPAIMTWEYIAGGSTVENEECYAGFYYNWHFLMTASTVEFFTPFVSVTFFNLSIYLNIRRRTKPQSEGIKEMWVKAKAGGQKGKALQHLFFFKLQNPEDSKTKEKKMTQKNSHAMITKVEIQHGNSESADLIRPLGEGPSDKPDGANCNDIQSQSIPPLDGHIRVISNNSSHRYRLLRDKKVAKSLAIIVCTFGVCWAPYTLLMIIRAACNDTCVSKDWYEVTFWLLWINSAINPVLYPLCHNSFRKAFVKILCQKKFKIKPQMSLKYT
ncbi:histamine H3 receptor-like [Polypterus senegalus]|uniref:histamine H3 receptor-like n=1 Tax=Polypterus senegalus TaxID=55291 RepID=UPI001966A760|nr:histamine H3 receptor-like [Polypterus senegalus]